MQQTFKLLEGYARRIAVQGPLRLPVKDQPGNLLISQIKEAVEMSSVVEHFPPVCERA